SGGDSYSGDTFFDYNTTFNNSGTVDSQSGVLFFDHGSDSGTVNVAANAVFVSQACTLAGSPTFTGPGSLQGFYNGNNAVLNGLMMFNNATLSGTLTLASNAVANLTSVFNSPVSFNAVVFTNYGAINWGGVNLSGNSAQIYNYGLWDAQTNNTLAGGSGTTTTFNNFGTFRKSGGDPNSGATLLDFNVIFNNAGMADSQNGQLAILGSYSLAGGKLNFGINSSNDLGTIHLAGNATLTGTLGVNLNHNYAPTAGSSFPVLTYDSETGAFTDLKLPSGLSWQTNYGATTFTLSVSAVLPAQLSVTEGGNNTISFAWNAVPGQTYQVQYTTNLPSTNWISLGGVITVTNETVSVSDAVNADPQRFYRVVFTQ
ncbi:MAG: hypothetical protein ABSD57_15180, partial [Verrucomicrobiota bacterium]